VGFLHGFSIPNARAHGILPRGGNPDKSDNAPLIGEIPIVNGRNNTKRAVSKEAMRPGTTKKNGIAQTFALATLAPQKCWNTIRHRAHGSGGQGEEGDERIVGYLERGAADVRDRNGNQFR